MFLATVVFFLWFPTDSMYNANEDAYLVSKQRFLWKHNPG